MPVQYQAMAPKGSYKRNDGTWYIPGRDHAEDLEHERWQLVGRSSEEAALAAFQLQLSEEQRGALESLGRPVTGVPGRPWKRLKTRPGNLAHVELVMLYEQHKAEQAAKAARQAQEVTPPPAISLDGVAHLEGSSGIQPLRICAGWVENA